MNPIAWAFQQQVPTAEKLVLVYLASRANAAGVGLWDRDALAAATDYKPRSIQRLIKSLRDAGLLLEDSGDWYVLELAKGGDMGALEQLPEAMPIFEEGKPTGRHGVIVPPLLTDDELERAGNAIAERMVDAGDYLLDQLANFESRLAAELVRFMAAADRLSQAPPAPPEPPPDPVLLDPRYQHFVDMGIGETKAYAWVRELLEEPETAASEPASAPIEADPPQPGAQRYADTTSGRLQRVADLLGATVTPETEEAWLALELEEDRHTVDGESATGFELLYPAIVDSARRNRGMPLEQFLDADRIKACRAPWDRDPDPTAQDDPALEAEVSTMLAEIEAAAHPNCQVNPRVVEKGDDGVTRIETIVGYHRRVSQVHRQLQRLKAMGAA